MTSSSERTRSQPTERSPLLETASSPDDEEANDGVIPRAGNVAEDNQTPLPDEPSTRQLLLVMSGTWLGSFFAALDSTIIATLTAPISASFNSLSLLSWLASAYFIANAALQPLAGRLTDIFSRRWGLIFSNVMFGLGNLICGLAQDEWVMILGRVVAGCGGGGLTAISTFVGSDLIPLRRRGVWQGIGNIMYGVGAGLGAVLGGWINDVWGWRKAFLILVPFTAVSGTMVSVFVNVPVKHSDKSALKRVDFLGAFTLILTLVLLLLGLNSGGNIVPWNHPLIYTTLSLSLISLLAFIYIELRHALEPVIPVKLLLNRTVLSACFTNWFSSMVIFSILFYGPIYFQVKGLSTTQAGIRLAPQSIGNAVGSIGTGLIMRSTGRYYYLSIGIHIISIAANVIISAMNLETPLWVIVVSFFMAGIGFAGMLTVTLLALISAVEHKDQAVITSASYAFRSTGSAIGITIASAVFQNLLKKNLWAAIGNKEGGEEAVGRLRDSLDVINRLPVKWKDAVQLAYMESLRGVFLTALGISVLAGVVSLGMREHTLFSSLSRDRH
ncbi:MAG: hypothetical protein Q9164_003291 [Protoblastenia rupestris]